MVDKIMRDYYNGQLKELHEQLIQMGKTCEESIEKSYEALKTKDLTLVDEIMKTSDEISHMERDIEGKCMKLLLLQQPVAADLRNVSASLKVITDMERIGIQAGDIAEIIKTGDFDFEENEVPLGEMAKETIGMLKDSMKAFVNEDVELARATAKRDDVVDNLFLKVREKLCSGKMMENQRLDQLMIAKYYERIGDHSVNIAEWVIYAVKGKHDEGWKG